MKSSHASALESKRDMEQFHYVDTHAHIFAEEFTEDFEEMLKRTEEAHVDEIMIITLGLEETRKALEFAKRDPAKYKVSAGIFPEDTDKMNDEYWEQFAELCRDPGVACIGEIGLDYYWVKDEELRAKQRVYFAKQIDLANELHKPYAVHARDAIQDTFDIMKEHGGRGLLHCFAGTKEMAKEFTKRGFYIALGGALTFKNARHSVEVASTVDARYLLTETDCPYMSPVPKRGKRNEPANIPYITAKMAECRGISTEEMACIIAENWKRFFEEV